MVQNGVHKTISTPHLTIKRTIHQNVELYFVVLGKLKNVKNSHYDSFLGFVTKLKSETIYSNIFRMDWLILAYFFVGLNPTKTDPFCTTEGDHIVTCYYEW